MRPQSLIPQSLAGRRDFSLHPGNCRRVIVAAENSRAGDEGVGTRRRDRTNIVGLDAAVNFQPDFPATSVDAAYQTLGVDKESSNDESKKAYRRLMNKNHPDKLASKNPDSSAIAEAERRTREVRSAYTLLKSRRSIR